MKSVLILQNALANYRRPVIDELGKYYKITVIHAGQAPVCDTSSNYEINVSQVKAGPFYLQNFAQIFKIRNQFDVVISMFDLRWPAYILPFLIDRHFKWILWGHRYSDSWVTNSIRDLLMRSADRILLYGDEEISRMVLRGINPSKIVIAPNTIHVPNHADLSNEDKSSLLFVGRLQPRKRIDLIIRAFSELQGSISSNIVLDIVGSGLLDTKLHQLAVDLNIEQKVFFHGPIRDNTKLANIFARAFAYVSPGPVGLGVLHSFAYGVPVVTLQEGRHGPEFHNLVHDFNSLVLMNEAELAPALAWLCNNPELTRVLGRNAYLHYSQRRTLDHMIAGFRKAIEE